MNSFEAGKGRKTEKSTIPRGRSLLQNFSLFQSAKTSESTLFELNARAIHTRSDGTVSRRANRFSQ